MSLIYFGTINLHNININHCHAASAELVKRAVDHGSEQYIYFVQEPLVHNNLVSGLNGIGNIFYLQTNNVVTRTCIIASAGLDLWLVPDLSNGDITTCAMKIRGQLVYLIAAYFDIKEDIASNPINEFLSELNRKKIPCLMNCDTNSHSTVWHSPSNNSRGDDFELLICEQNLTVHNSNAVHTFFCQRAGYPDFSKSWSIFPQIS